MRINVREIIYIGGIMLCWLTDLLVKLKVNPYQHNINSTYIDFPITTSGSLLHTLTINTHFSGCRVTLSSKISPSGSRVAHEGFNLGTEWLWIQKCEWLDRESVYLDPVLGSGGRDKCVYEEWSVVVKRSWR